MTKFQTFPVQKPILNSQMMAEKGWIQSFSTMNQIFDGDWGAKSLVIGSETFNLSITPQFLKVFAEIPSFTTINSFDLSVSNANGILYLVNDVDIIRPPCAQRIGRGFYQGLRRSASPLRDHTCFAKLGCVRRS